MIAFMVLTVPSSAFASVSAAKTLPRIAGESLPLWTDILWISRDRLYCTSWGDIQSWDCTLHIFWSHRLDPVFNERANLCFFWTSLSPFHRIVLDYYDIVHKCATADDIIGFTPHGEARGFYEHHLIKAANNGWKVDKMKLIVTLVEGNTDIPRLAQQKVKAGQ